MEDGIGGLSPRSKEGDRHVPGTAHDLNVHTREDPLVPGKLALSPTLP